MLPKANRLRTSRDFAQVLRRGCRCAGPALVVHLATDITTGPPRVGFTASRAVGPAVTRNRLRRRLRHLMRARAAELPFGARVVVRIRPGAVRLSYAELGRELDGTLARALRAK
ncbi:MAG: ribonuclease P protein component [Mycobacteriales bacterium]